MNTDTITIGGFMATGKSTVGPLVSKILGFRFIDLDRCIEEQCSMSITTIFKRNGEAYFRNVEEQILQKLIVEKQVVISLGGGSLHWNENHSWIDENSQLFVLWASWPVVKERLQQENRPLSFKAEQLFEERKSLYRNVGKLVLADSATPQEISDEIVRRLYE